MIRTPTLTAQADKACQLANAAAARHRLTKPKRRLAKQLRTLALIAEIRKSGGHVSRKHETAVRG